ncbi:peptidoglycan-recognition protein LB-like [Danaus plexippus]|uniref:Peptidoglycan-recognition protein n=1 Tax=Danaus plexippus plexippus TaxID=278856 RepID=A0A212FMH5_DANPL|nr:peptidoglycan-recognition protein LB-like [Danaus plexippus]XP_032527676.1 peptidoglycan-recognition protein LB-like [Danaus plexippus]XP_032527677.1 peptidoglycan-recognition protein LB-like [Danaus plexippus plexippus]OWR54948.1 peptidoglycan recognition protein B [Danaus plexippus plexippus]
MTPIIIGLFCVAVGVVGSPLPRTHSRHYSHQLEFVSKADWGGRHATSVTKLKTPVPLVVIHHSYIPGACYTKAACSAAMQSMQNAHQITNGWADIGYNFAVGSDGRVYEGRGFNRLGAHAVGVNVKSIGIVLIGNWVSEVPPRVQLESAQALIKLGVDLGYISPDYSLMGHRQVGSTECPGGALQKEISTWPKFQPNREFHLT